MLPEDPLSDSFAHLDEEALQRLQRTSPWLNDALLTPEDKEEITRALRAKPSKAIRFCASGEEHPPESRVDAPLLFKEVEAVRQRAGEANLHKHVVVLHQITSRTDRARLAQWNKRDELVKPLFDSVHFQLYARRERYQALREGEMESTALLQQRLVDSRFVAQSLYAREAVGMLEFELGVRLVRVLLHQQTLLLLFEWLDVQSFAIVVCCGAHTRCEATRALAARHILSLSGDDMMKYTGGGEAKTSEAKTDAPERELPLELQSETHPMPEVRKALQQMFISYITLAYVRRDG